MPRAARTTNGTDHRASYTQGSKRGQLKGLIALQNALIGGGHEQRGGERGRRRGLPADLQSSQAMVVKETARILSCQGCTLMLIEGGADHRCGADHRKSDEENWIISKMQSAVQNTATVKNTAAIKNTRMAEDTVVEWKSLSDLDSARGLIYACLRMQKTIHVENAASDGRYDSESDAIQGVETHSMLCAPLLVNGECVGVIQAINKVQGADETIAAFNDDDKEVIEMIAGLTAGAVQLQRVDQQFKIMRAEIAASEWELTNAQNALKALFENLPEAIYMVDGQYQMLAINQRRKQRIPAHPAGESKDRERYRAPLCYRELFGRDTPCPDCLVQETFRSAQPKLRIERRGATGAIAGSQEQRAISFWNDEEGSEWEIHTIPVLDGQQKTWQVILLEKDITEKRQLENILTQSEKLAALGQLAAGIAHEINNPLTAIIANAQILHRSLPAEDDLQESVDLIARAGARAVQVVRNLLDFARKEEYHLSVTNLNENLQRALELVQHELLARGIEIDFDPDPDLPSILASQDHLQSVWLNLLLNAIDSLDKTPASIQVSTRKSGKNILVTVTDNGKGIPAERLGRIFEPFYTTKAPGRGTGLGLSVSSRIIKQHGGSIQVESQAGKGSIFTVTLPLH